MLTQTYSSPAQLRLKHLVDAFTSIPGFHPEIQTRYNDEWRSTMIALSVGRVQIARAFSDQEIRYAIDPDTILFHALRWMLLAVLDVWAFGPASE